MTKTTYSSGTVVTAAWLNAIQSFAFDDQDFDGHYSRLTDDALSNTSTQIKPQWYGFRDALSVTTGTGLVANYAGGSVTLQNNLIATIAPATIALTNNSTNYVFVNESGVVQAATSLPVRCLPLASMVTVSGVISGAITDLRPRYRILPRPSALPVFGSGGYEGDLTISSNTTLTGQRFVRNFTVNAGVTLTVTGFLYIVASGNIDIQGTINVLPAISGGKGFYGTTTQAVSTDPGAGLGGGGGINSTPSNAYSYFASFFGSGGASGFTAVNVSASTIQSSIGGQGGGAFICDAAGSLVVGGALVCKGGNAILGSVINAGGGSTIALSGGGGGSGGLIWLKSLTSLVVSASASLNVQGGTGGNGVRQNYALSSGGGGGGGGGYVVLNSASINTTGATISVSGGSGGLSAGSAPGIAAAVGGSYGGVGGVGSDGNGSSGSVGQLILQSFIPI